MEYKRRETDEKMGQKVINTKEAPERLVVSITVVPTALMAGFEIPVAVAISSTAIVASFFARIGFFNNDAVAVHFGFIEPFDGGMRRIFVVHFNEAELL